MKEVASVDNLTNRLHTPELKQQLSTIWERFFQMIKIPYPKTRELPHGDASQMVNFSKEYANSNRFGFEVDNCQNVCIGVAATEGHETDREIVVQGHHDAVFVGEPDPSVFGVNPIVTEDGEWVKGDGTNLTADNRLGCAVALTAVEALAQSGKAHGPIKILLTAGEDSGLIGATYLGVSKSNFLNGNQTVINVDSSDGPEWITIGCASGSRDNITIPVNRESIGSKKLVKFTFSGFSGGHSGLDIGKDRPSSIKFFAEMFSRLKLQFPNIGLVSIKAGEAFNAIPASGSFILAVNGQDEEKVRTAIADYIDQIKKQIPPDAPDDYRKSRININALPQKLSQDEEQIDLQLDTATTDLLINVLSELPQGVGQKDNDTILYSNNVGKIEIDQDTLTIQTMTRGKETSYRDILREQIRKVAEKYHVSLEEKLAYRHWLDHPERNIVKQALRIGRELLARETKTRVSGGGLEPGIFEGEFPGLEAISIAVAQIKDEHSLDERVNIASLEEGYRLLYTLLTEAPKAYSSFS